MRSLSFARRGALSIACGAAASVLLVPADAAAQAHDPSQHANHTAAAAPTARSAGSLPTMPGQDAYGAIGEIVRMLDRDPSTDWSKVDLERLRQHLIDMNIVTLQSAVRRQEIPGGLQMDVTGTGRTVDAIRRMTTAHGRQLAAHGLTATSTPIDGGARFTVVASNPSDARAVARVRGLGFIGVMTLGDHHAPHHLAMASGAPMSGHD